MNNLAFKFQIIRFLLKQSAVKPRDAIGEKEEEPALIVPKISFHISSLFQFIFVCLSYFTYFSHNYHNYSIFRDVPECSMFLFLLTAGGFFL